MRVALSSAAAPVASLEELVLGSARRGLAGIEPVMGHGHGIRPGLPGRVLRRLRAEAARDGAPILAFRVPVLDRAATMAAARLSAELCAPIIAPWYERGDAALNRLAALYRAEGGRLLLEVRSEPVLAADLASRIRSADPATLGLAWSIGADEGDLADVGAAMLAAGGAGLASIRLAGGGPEAAEQDGRGIGSLMASLALSAYRGVLVLAPSGRRTRVAWRVWLTRGRGWGCGGKQSDPALLRLDAAPDAGRKLQEVSP